MADTDTTEPGIAMPARFIPTPHSVSAEAQAFLSRGLDIAPPQIAVEDKDGWRAYITAVEAQMVRISGERAKAHPADIAEHRLGNAPLYEVTPHARAADLTDRAILHIHGGAFIVGGGRSAAHTAQSLAHATGITSWSVDYRMPPDHPYPAGLDDAVEAYRFLLERYDPAHLTVEGSSAGANLAAATILRARDEGLPLPGACVLHTAGVDLTHQGDTFQTNAIIDVVLRSQQDDTIRLYVGDHDPAHPYLSPVFADLTKGFPPTILLSGTRDLLLSPTVMMHRALRRAGVEAELHVFEAMPHGGFADSAPEDRERLAETAAFVLRQMRRVS
ncbi:MAG TPA: alpha/beta hydrolase [Sphingobium sp.]|uniref:alpha/beta hydrolase n=1 Tax=Sphingobium sp. TaxID=1912891 RepID=UPI002ED2A4A2